MGWVPPPPPMRSGNKELDDAAEAHWVAMLDRHIAHADRIDVKAVWGTILFGAIGFLVVAIVALVQMFRA